MVPYGNVYSLQPDIMHEVRAVNCPVMNELPWSYNIIMHPTVAWVLVYGTHDG